MRKLVIGCVALFLLTPATSMAEDSGFEFGARIGYAHPLGGVEGGDDSDLKDFVSGQIFPIWADIGYRINPTVFIAGYFSYGIGGPGDVVGDWCDLGNADCLAVSSRLGVQAQFHLLPEGSADPWLGVGTGFESTGVTFSGDDEEITFAYGGWEALLLQGGVDFKLSEYVALGPFMGLTLSQYSSISCDGDLCGTFLDEEIDEKKWHEWLFVGIRGKFGPF